MCVSSHTCCIWEIGKEEEEKTRTGHKSALMSLFYAVLKTYRLWCHGLDQPKRSVPVDSFLLTTCSPFFFFFFFFVFFFCCVYMYIYIYMYIREGPAAATATAAGPASSFHFLSFINDTVAIIRH